jgi:hypothetical protein
LNDFLISEYKTREVNKILFNLTKFSNENGVNSSKLRKSFLILISENEENRKDL